MKKSESISDIITRRRMSARNRNEYISLALRVLLLGITAWILLSQVFLLTQTHGNDMFPSIKDGDLVFGFRLQQDYRKNDVVVYSVDGETYIGRVIARATDTVMLDGNGTVTVNGTAQNGEILYPTYAKDGIEYPYQVPEDSVFILGDYRTQTTDSRDFGAVSLKDVDAKVITILRRRGL